DEEYEDQFTLRDVGNSLDRNNAKRGAFAAALQYQPTDNLNIVADVLYTRSENYNNRSGAKYDVDRALTRTILFAPDAMILEDGGLEDADYHNTYVNLAGARCIDDDVQIEGFDCLDRTGQLKDLREEYRNNFQESWLGGLNIEYNVGAWQVTGDLYYNKMSTEVTEVNVEAFSRDWEHAVALDTRGGGYADFSYDASDVDLDNLQIEKLRLKQRVNEGEQWGARLDFAYELGNGNLESVQFGVRYNTAEFDYIESQAPDWGYEQHTDPYHAAYTPEGAAAYSDSVDAFTDGVEIDGYKDAVFGQYVLPNLGLQSAIDYLDKINHAGTKEWPEDYGPCENIGNVGQYVNLDGRPTGKMLTDNCLELPETFNVKEDTINLYVAGDFNFDIGGNDVFITAGLRYVYTENTSAGVVTETVLVATDDDDGVIEYTAEAYADPNNITITSSSFNELLPSINLTTDLTDTLQLRLSAARSLSRPDLFDITPRNSIKFPDGEDIEADWDQEETCEEETCSIDKGNANLKPYTAWNYDLTLMWQMPTDGFIAASIYHKDIKDFIFEYTYDSTEIADYEGIKFEVTQPINSGEATVDGFEIAWHQPFTFLPAPFDGLGMQLNYSYTDSSFSGLSENEEQLFGDYGLPGSSKNNANAVLYFETDRFSARIAYVYRDAYFNNYTGGTSDTPSFYDDQEKLSASISYKITDMIKVKVQGNNLTEDDTREFSTYDTLLTRYTTKPKSYSVSITAKF
ncbi:MAG: TonB-dependent receptor, partial [Colwellia sp.]|nr:TonB-dependent receptor [Colwellia sp.]